MIYKIVKAAPRLQSIVKDFSLLHFDLSNNEHKPIKPFPANTQHSLVFYLRGRVCSYEHSSGTSIIFPKISINGSQTSRYDFHLDKHYLMLSVNFQAGGMAKFFKIPLPELTDIRIDAEAILNPEINRVFDRIENTGSYEDILYIAEEYLWNTIKCLRFDFQPIDAVCKLISDSPSCLSIEKLASLACLSISQFERRFLQQNGITPKLFLRINRFYRAYQIKDQNPDLDWFSIAFQTGYNDYQHLVKDFKQFSNTVPNSLIKAQALSPERILGLG